MYLNINYLICALAILIVHVVCSDKAIARARVESCPGCQLNRLPEVKQFIFEDVPKYDNVEFKKIPGAPPELVFLDEADQELDRVHLKGLDRKQCNQLLTRRGFKVNENKGEL